MKFFALVLLSILVCGAAAHALSTDELAQKCKGLRLEKPTEEDVGNATLCAGYILGVAEDESYLFGKVIISKELDMCIPDSVTAREMSLVFLKYVDDHPETSRRLR